MAEYYLIQDSTLAGIADAIRTKDGSSEPIFVNEYAGRISAIEAVVPEGAMVVTAMIAEAPSDANWQSTAYGNGRYVRFSGSNQVGYSSDGATWVYITMPGSSANWSAVTYSDYRFTAKSETAEIAVSYDGYNWYTSFTGIADADGNDVTGEVLSKLGKLPAAVTV